MAVLDVTLENLYQMQPYKSGQPIAQKISSSDHNKHLIHHDYRFIRGNPQLAEF